jgi:phosphate-selective porin
MHKKLLVAAMLAVTVSAGAFAQTAASGAVAAHPTPAKPAIFVAEAPHAASAGQSAREEHSVTREGFLKKAAERFEAMDANHDGTVTPDERRAFFKAHRAELHEHHGPELPASGAQAPHLPK